MTFPAHTVVGTCVLGLVAVFTPESAARAETAPQPPRIIEVHDERLTVDIVKVPLAEVLAEVARQTNAEVRGELRQPRDVTARFRDVPLAQGLDRLLAGQNYVLIYADDGSLRSIPLLGGSYLGGPSFSIRPTSAGTASAVVPSEGLTALLAQSVPVSGAVAEKLGSDMASLGQLASLWLKESDAAVGAESLRSGFKAVEAMPDLRAATLDVANTYSDVDLARLFRGFAGPRAEELVDLIASQTRVAEFRTKASLVLRRLQSGS